MEPLLSDRRGKRRLPAAFAAKPPEEPPPNPFDGSRRPEDIRSFFTSELAYLRHIDRRFGCAICDTAANDCASCRTLHERIALLEKEQAAAATRT